MIDDLAGCPRSSAKTLSLRWSRPFRPNAAPGPDHALAESAAAETLDKRGANFEGAAALQHYLGGHLRSSGLPRHQGSAPASWPRVGLAYRLAVRAVLIRPKWENQFAASRCLAISAAVGLWDSAAYVPKRDSANDITITQMFITLAIMLEVY